MKEFIRKLSAELSPHYAPPFVNSGHDTHHVSRMIALGNTMPWLDFNRDLFAIAVWLHNLDRSQPFEGKDIGEACAEFLVDAPLDDAQKKLVTDAVLQHSKKDDEPGDSSLLVALRIADKVDRFRFAAAGIAAICAHGHDLPAYDAAHPFGYGDTAESNVKTLYAGFFRVLEWYGMLPSDEARGLIRDADMQFHIAFIRRLGRDMAEILNVADETEGDLKKALGKHYAKFA